jgi:hypothetical protein
MRSVCAFRAIVRGIRDGRLTAADCRLLMLVCLMQLLALAAVAWLPIRVARRWLAKLRPLTQALGGIGTEARVIWAIEATARWRVAGSSCLARALAAELLLPPGGHPLTIVIGVTGPAGGRLKSHAWLERDGHVLIGGSESRADYFPMIAWTTSTA